MPNPRRMQMATAGGVVSGDMWELWAWGGNVTHGPLGLGDKTNRSSPVQVGSLVNWAKVATNGTTATNHMMAIKGDGTLWSWGNDGSGRLGRLNASSGTDPSSSPVQVGTATNWTEIAVGNDFSLMVNSAGEMYSCGDGSSGPTGLGNETDVSVPTQVGSDTNWATVAAGANYSLAIKTTGTMWGFGDGAEYKTGLGNTTDVDVPTQIGSASNWLKASTSHESSFALKTDGTIWSWGNGSDGIQGHGTSGDNKSVPTQVGSRTDWVEISSGGKTRGAIDDSGRLYTWGDGTDGSLGHGNTTDVNTPTQVGSLTNWSDILMVGQTGHTLAIKTDGTLWSWGDNSEGATEVGQLGQSISGGNTKISSPVQVGSLTTWKGLGGVHHQSFALKEPS